MSPRDTAFNALLVAADRLGRDELLVLGEIADRLVKGQPDYGDMNIDDSGRDWEQEAHEERLDYLVYRSCIRHRRARQR